MAPKSRALPDHRRLLWALLIVVSASSFLVLAKSESGRAISKQEAGVKISAPSTTAQIKPIDSQASISQHQPQQQVAEKKQGDQVVDSLFNSEEYVQIKPEEINGEVSSKDLIDSATALALGDLPNSSPATGSTGTQTATGIAAAAASQQQPQSPIAEHKSAADDELSAHLAQDSIGALESGPRPYAAPADPRAARPYGPPARGGYMPPPPPRPYGRPPRPYGLSRARRGPAQHKPMPPPPAYGREPRAPMPPGTRYPGPQQLPGTPGYISSMVPHAPRPAHYGAASQTPYQVAAPSPVPSRYLPRGAAAGYAAFREFVRAQANRYKGQPAPAQSMGSHEPVAYNAAPSQAGPSYGSGQALVEMAAAYRQPGEQKPHQSGADSATSKGPQTYTTSGPEQYQSGQPATATSYATGGQRSKVSVAQAYIPHLAPNGGHQQAPAPADSNNYQANPVLAKLYGGHAPQGVGRPEYNKDYGMVIHYPQATVYTEPMTVDQLHKLAGGSITQILEQLQHNLASGHRNEANTIRPNNKHHLGHGLAIHAKEYYAPSKSGHYVPTTAAVISSHESSAPSGGESYSQGNSQAPVPTGYSNETPQTPQAGGYQQRPAGYQPQNPEPSGYGQGKQELGSGYERVRAAVAASATSAIKYGSAGGSVGKPNYQSLSAPQQNANYANQQQTNQGAGLSGFMKPYEPLGTLANIIGSELESLYNKANSVLSKQIDPELHAHVQAHLKSLAKVAGPLKYSEHDHRSPLALRPAHSNGASYNGPPPPPPPPPAQGAYQLQGHYQGPPPPPQLQYGPRGRAPRRPQIGYEGGPAGAHRPGPNRYQNGPRPRPQRPAAYQQQQQHQQQQSYNAEQQVFQRQVNQMLNDFNLGEDNYGAKSQPIQATNQGYPSKVMQKYQQQQHPQQSANAYEHGDGLEIPQGPNDQIGEISELIEALKGSLDGHKPENGVKDGKTEDAQYIASALGQVPSYAIQVPVGQQQPPSAGEHAVYEAAKKASEQQPQQYAGQAPAAYQAPASYQAPQQHVVQHVVQQQEQPAYQQAGPQISAQLPYLAPPAPVAPTNYESAPSGGSSEASSSYHQQPNEYTQQQPQGSSYGQYKQQSAGPQQGSGYGQQAAAQAEAYGNQQQQQDSYAVGQQQAGQEYSGKSAAADYNQHEAAAPAGYEAQAQGGGYSQEHQPAAPNAPVEQQAQYQQQQSGYASTGHTQVINHLVPVQQQQQHQQAADYGQSKQAQPLAAITTSVQHQPVNQISVAAPTESQYQSAQPLSSFVESLPSDYQELLRQPAHASIMESLTNVPSDHHQEQLYSNATTSDLTKNSIASAPVQEQPHHNQHHHQRRQYDSHHLSGSASSLKATYLQVPAGSSATSSSSVSKSSAQAPSSQSSSSIISSTSSSSSNSTSSSSSSSAPSPSSAAASASPSSSSSAKASSTSQHDS